MVRKNLVIVLTAIMVISIFLISAYEQSREAKIGVVNLQICFNKYDRLKDLNEEVKKFLEDSNKKLDELQKKARELYTMYKNLEGSPKLQEEKYKEYRSTLFEYEFNKKLDEEKLVYMQSDSQIKIYNDIKDVIKKLSEEQGFTLVLKTEDPLEQDRDTNISHSIGHRGVLYFEKSIDITDTVLKRMNEEYAKRKGNK